MKSELLRIENGSKEIECQEILHRINLQIIYGETTGIILNNLNEADCLLCLLRGYDNFSHGYIFQDNQLTSILGEVKQIRQSVTLIDYNKNLIRNLTIAENVFIVNGKVKEQYIRQHQLAKKLTDIFDQFNLQIDVYKSVDDLNNLEIVIIELIKAYINQYSLIIIDQRYNSLTTKETEQLFDLVAALKRRRMAFVLLNNIIPEMLHYADTLTIISHGRTIWTLNRDNFKENLIRRLLLHGSVNEPKDFATPKKMNDTEKLNSHILELRGISTTNLNQINLSLDKGELIDVLCENESGFYEFIHLLKGEIKPQTGQILLDKSPYCPHNSSDAIEQGICFIENNPLMSNLFFNLSVFDNISLVRGSKFKKIWWSRSYQKAISQDIYEIFGNDITQVSLSELPLTVLQKIVFYKWLIYRPKVLVCINPYSTVDIHMALITDEMIQMFIQRNISVMIIEHNIHAVCHSTSRRFVLQ
jgi:ABC-type sugar transport system ATPase subunit